MRVGPKRRLSTKELMLLTCGAYRKLLRVLWIARRSNHSILKEINPEYSLEGLMLKLKLWYFSHLMRITTSLGKTLMLGKIEGRRRRGWQRMRWLDGITDSMDMGLVDSRSWWWRGRPGVLHAVQWSHRVGHDWATELCWILNPPTPQFKSINSLVLSFLYSPTLTSIHDHWKNQSFD